MSDGMLGKLVRLDRQKWKVRFTQHNKNVSESNYYAIIISETICIN